MLINLSSSTFISIRNIRIHVKITSEKGAKKYLLIGNLSVSQAEYKSAANAKLVIGRKTG
jgi:hypothetical protein